MLPLGRVLLNFVGRPPERGQEGRAQRAQLLQGGGPLGVIVTSLLHPVHDLVDALLQR
jgi:hypothetical protein